MRLLAAFLRSLIGVAMLGAIVGCGSAVLKNDGGHEPDVGGGTAGAGGRGGGSGSGAAGSGAAGSVGGSAGTSTGGAGPGGAAGSSSGGAAGATAGAAGSGGGTSGSGGATGSGGSAAGCGTRDCTSTRDNDCNGTPDNQDTSCTTCVVGNSVACSTGMPGICATGMQMCQLAANHQSVGYGACAQNAAKGSRDCTSSGDNDCNGQVDSMETTFCQCALSNSPRSCSTGLLGICTAGTQTCVVSADKTTSAWGSCTQLKAKGTETCANPGTDDDCDGVSDNLPSTSCNVGGQAVGACLNGGSTGCNGTTAVCNPAVSAIGDVNSTAWHINTAPNGSWDWNCDGATTKQYPDQAPTPPTCSGLSMSACSAVPQVFYALTPFACGDQGDIGSLYCVWNAQIPACTNKSGQSTGYQQGCR